VSEFCKTNRLLAVFFAHEKSGNDIPVYNSCEFFGLSCFFIFLILKVFLFLAR